MAIGTPPTLAVTSGEPAGIGPDICLQVTQQSLDCRLVILADYDLMKSRAKKLHLPVQIINISEDINTLPSTSHKAGRLFVYHQPLAEHTVPGTLKLNLDSVPDCTTPEKVLTLSPPVEKTCSVLTGLMTSFISSFSAHERIKVIIMNDINIMFFLITPPFIILISSLSISQNLIPLLGGN